MAEKVTTELAHRAVADAEARTAYKVAEAKSRLLAKDDGGPRRTVQEIEAIAMIATQDEYRTHAIAEARFKAAQEAGRNYRAQLDALRSINANLRALVTA
jgi:hypothetical protein